MRNTTGTSKNEVENVQNQRCIRLVYTCFMHFKYFKCKELATSSLHLIGQIICRIVNGIP